MYKEVSASDMATGHDTATVSAKFNLEPLLFDLASESLGKAKEADEQRRKVAKTEKRDLELQVVKYCAGTIVFAHAFVEAYLNWILQHRMLTHDDALRRRLGEILFRIRPPVWKRWISIIEATGFLAIGKWAPVSNGIEKDAEKLAELRNFIVHYEAKLTPIDKLPGETTAR